MCSVSVAEWRQVIITIYDLPLQTCCSMQAHHCKWTRYLVSEWTVGYCITVHKTINKWSLSGRSSTQSNSITVTRVGIVFYRLCNLAVRKCVQQKSWVKYIELLWSFDRTMPIDTKHTIKAIKDEMSSQIYDYLLKSEPLWCHSNLWLELVGKCFSPCGYTYSSNARWASWNRRRVASSNPTVNSATATSRTPGVCPTEMPRLLHSSISIWSKPTDNVDITRCKKDRTS